MQSDTVQLSSHGFLSSHLQILTFAKTWKRLLSCHRFLEHCFARTASFASRGDSVSDVEKNITLPFIVTPGVCPYYWH